MAVLIIRHPVRDYVAWRPVYDAYEAARTAAGLTNGRVYRSAEDPNDILILFDILATPDGRALTYVDQRDNVGNVWSQPLAGGPPTQLTDFKDNQIFSFDWLRDGRLVSSRGFRASDAVLIKDSR